MDNKGSLKWLWMTLLIIGIVIVGLMSIVAVLFGGYMGGGFLSIFRIIPLAILGLLVWGLISVAKSGKNESERSGSGKVYKQPRPSSPMKIQTLFYVAGVIFIFLSVWYFAGEFLVGLPRGIKLILLIVSVIVSFVVAEFMRQGEI